MKQISNLVRRSSITPWWTCRHCTSGYILPASRHCSTEGPMLLKAVDIFYHPVTCVVPPGAISPANREEVSLLVWHRFLMSCSWSMWCLLQQDFIMLVTEINDNSLCVVWGWPIIHLKQGGSPCLVLLLPFTNMSSRSNIVLLYLGSSSFKKWKLMHYI